MTRGLAIVLAVAMLGLVLWLPAGFPPSIFYRAVLSDHTACAEAWGEPFALPALRNALADSHTTAPASTSKPSADSPTAEAERQLARRMQNIGERLHATRYMRALDAMSALALYRVHTLLYLAPAWVLVLLPALFDAAMRRIVRTHEFRRHDPERFSLGIAGVMVMIAALMMFCVVPVFWPPASPVAAMLFLTYCVHVMVANYHHSAR